MPTKPDYIDKELELIAGRNIFGSANLRVVWGADIRDHRGNFKYLHPETGKPLECWVLERWMPPGFFGGKEAWNATRWYYDDRHGEYVDLRGEYPTRGAYVMLRPIVNKADDSFLPLDRQVLEAIKRSVRDDEEFASLSESARMDTINAHEALREKDRQNNLEREMGDKREYHLRNWDTIDRSIKRGYSITPR